MSLLLLFGGSGGAPAKPATTTFDYPNPRAASRSIDLATFAPPLNLPLVLHQDTFFGGVGQPPPQRDWPVPKGPLQPGVWLQTISQRVQIQLIGADAFFAGPGRGPVYDYPNPNLGKPYPSQLRTWIDPFKIHYGSDTFFGAPGQVRTFDWQLPNPGKPYPIDLRTFTRPPVSRLLGQDTFFGAPGQVPPQREWPVPKGAQFPSDLRNFTSSVLSRPIGQDVFFGGPGRGPVYDYPNPRGPQYPVSLRTMTDGFRVRDFPFSARGGPLLIRGSSGGLPPTYWKGRTR